MLYRVGQFFTGLFKRLSKEDMKIVNTYLSETEKKLFLLLPEHEKVHCVNVARDVLNASVKSGNYDILLVKAALLHDIGKINGGLNLITKSILVILNKLSPKLLKKLMWVNSINTYYNHPEIALTLMGDANEYLKYLIVNHHNYDLKNDEKLKMLQESDSKN